MAPLLPPSPQRTLHGRDTLLPEDEGQALAKGPAFLAQFCMRKPTVQKVRRPLGSEWES